jgi:hypothetical protein
MAGINELAVILDRHHIMNKITLLISLSIIILGCSNQQPNTTNKKSGETTFSVKQLQEDFTVFRTSLEEIHPGLYSFISKDSLDIYFDNTSSKLNLPMTKDEFFRLLTPLIVKIYDEHTSLDFSYKYDSIKKLLPIKIRWVNNEPFINKNLLQNPNVILGSKIISINGRNVNEIFKELKSNYQNGTPDETLEYDVYSLHFDYLYASFIDQPDSFNIEAVNPVSKMKYVIHSPSILITDTVHCLRIPQMAANYCRKDTAYRFSIDKKNDFAKMTISGLNPYEMEATKIDFRKQLEQNFNSIEKNKIDNLIIDLRYCFGGDPLLGAELISYLADQPFHIFDTITSRIEKIPTYSKYANWTPEDWKAEAPLLRELKGSTSTKNGWSTLRDTTILPKRKFKGSLYILINSDIHSAAAITAALLKYNTTATFIGTPISGPYNSGNAIDLITITLPNTKINMYVPLLHYSYAIPDNLQENKKGLIPDILISPTINDIIKNKDLLLDSTISLVRTKNNR